ncbi:uncharacterized protein LOC110368488 [Fundulus heteroclitus]|uniref:uncharacterized protein LOC110368488 n=1 Tax=Fundulus heteroclitus TaxID=8078 RepID=UPI00165C7B7F|nr:uncharacterized protein LOC110368488 [Fundulus heteroclitus]
MMHPPQVANSLGRMMVNKIKREAKVLEALADVPGSARMDLLRKFWRLMMESEREPLAVLDDALYEYRHGKRQRPQSEAVASFLDVLDVSKASSDSTKAVHVLVCALHELPDNTAALLAKSGSETLNCILQMVDGVQDGQARLPESPPLPLQEEGELHWVAKFLIAANDLEHLKKKWGDMEISPEGLVELLYTSVDGLSRMQAGVSS